MKPLLTVGLTLALVLAGIFFPACGDEGDNSLQGGAEAGNPPVSTRVVTGSVPKKQNTLVARADVVTPTLSCVADEVTATDSAGETTTGEISTDCKFTIILIIGKAYSFGFTLNGNFVATMTFSNNASTLTTSVMVIGEGEASIDLGTVAIQGGKAFPEKQPATQTDQDGDGTTDFDDEDDNDNGVPDTLEEDCDLDGYWDVYDDDTSSCTSEAEEDDEGEDSDDGGDEGTDEGDDGSDDDTTGDDTEDGGEESLALIVEVNPRNGATNVGLDEEVEARAGCDIDSTTVDATTFAIRDQRGNAITCDYEISGSGTRMECDHDKSPFSRATTYSATVSGVTCRNGRLIEPTRWQWTTE